MSLRDRLRGLFGARVEEEETAELRDRMRALDAVPIADVADRASAQVCGVARSLSHPPTSGGPRELTVELYDGTGALDVVWVGRRYVPGIRPGTVLRVRGRVCRRDGVRTIFNPDYEIVPV